MSVPSKRQLDAQEQQKESLTKKRQLNDLEAGAAAAEDRRLAGRKERTGLN